MGYIIIVILGTLMFLAGCGIGYSRTWEFQRGSKRDGLVEEGIHTRRLGLCIGLEGLFIVLLSFFCMEKENPILLFIILLISVVACGIILYCIHKHNPMKKKIIGGHQSLKTISSLGDNSTLSADGKIR